jgi:hypothetical protein
MGGMSAEPRHDARSVRCDTRRGGVGTRGKQGEIKMERRKFLIGAGSAAIGSSALIGSGAFTSVQADRTVSIRAAGDANAFLSISKAEDEGGNDYPNAQEYVEVDNSTGEVSLDFTQSDDTNGSATGINRNAKSTFDNLLDITNNGTQDVVLSVKSDLIASQGGFLGIYAENGQTGDPANDGTADGSDNTGLSYNGDPTDESYWGTTTLSPGESASNIGIYIPKGVDFSQVSGGTLTFIAEKTGGNQD